MQVMLLLRAHAAHGLRCSRPALRVAFVQVTLLLTAHYYFWPPIEAGRNTDRFVAAVAGNAAAAAAAVRAAGAALGLELSAAA